GDAPTAMSREFVYTADDERIATYTVGSSWNWTIREASGKVLREFTSGVSGSSWQWTRDYVWRDGFLLSSCQLDTTRTTTFHYHLDHLGTPRRVSNDD